ncbi:MAG TPA: tRNA (adenosine(37)-N6)-dimethylallyltransferase MiaA [Gemmatimonadaceae bacterium]
MAVDSLRVICGPTAAGKSALAMALARRIPLAVLSADSRQIYRGFDIGTAKPTLGEQRAVPHRGIDLVDPGERYSAAAWADAALGWIDEVERAGRTPVVVGGTGFYVRALTAPLFEEPPLDPARRMRLQGALDALPTAELRRWCARLDPERAALGRAQLVRAIEVALLTGVPISRWHARAARAPRVRARYLVVDPGPPLRDRIAARVHAMLAAGWEGEVAALDARVREDAPAWNATGYATVRDIVRGRVDRRAAIDRIIIDTRQYAKRQRTWLRHQLDHAHVTRLDPTSPDALARAEAWWHERDEDEG